MKLIKIVALASVIAFAACTPTATQDTTPSPEIEVVETSDSPEAMMEAESAVVSVQANDFTYDVKEIRAKQGEKVKVSFTNNEGFHDFLIDELNVNSGMVGVGQTVELEIPTDQPGEYFFYCSVGDHRQRGMEGKLIIE